MQISVQLKLWMPFLLLLMSSGANFLAARGQQFQPFHQQQQQPPQYWPSNDNLLSAAHQANQINQFGSPWPPTTIMLANHEGEFLQQGAHRQQRFYPHQQAKALRELPIDHNDNSLFGQQELIQPMLSTSSLNYQQQSSLDNFNLNGRSIEEVIPVGGHLLEGPSLAPQMDVANANLQASFSRQHRSQPQRSRPQQSSRPAESQGRVDRQPRRGGNAALASSAASAKQPPVYRSAPKQISELAQIGKKKWAPSAPKYVLQIKQAPMKKVGDLHVAAGHYSKGHKKKTKKKKKVKKKKKKEKVIKIVKLKVKVKPKKKDINVHYYSEPVYHHKAKHHKPKKQQYDDDGKYYEHRSVPKKGAWKYAYRRGNKKHTIERKEKGHKSHFKTEVKWTDKKGKGHHVFDYNHHGKHKHGDQHYKAASSPAGQSEPTRVKPNESAASIKSQVRTLPATTTTAAAVSLAPSGAKNGTTNAAATKLD